MNAVAVRSELRRVTRKQARARAETPAVPKQQIIETHLRETIDPQRRREMIAEAAYYFAERRGFEPGYELNDWLAAEDQIDASLRLSDLAAAALISGQER